MLIQIANEGQEITSANYWSLDVEQAGKLFVPVNAGAIRVLVPRSQAGIVEDMRPAKECVLSRGPWPAMRLGDAIEIMWDDDSPSPFCLHLSPESFDMVPGEPTGGREWVISVWVYDQGRPKKAVEHVCHWRRVKALPCLDPWAPAG